MLIEPEIMPEKSEGGIIIPDQARRSLNEGRIIKKGPLVSDKLEVGMFIVFTQSSEYQLEMNDKTIVYAVNETNVLMFRALKPNKKDKLFPATTEQYECNKHSYMGQVPCPKCVEEYNKQIAHISRCAPHDHLIPCPHCARAKAQGLTH